MVLPSAAPVPAWHCLKLHFQDKQATNQSPSPQNTGQKPEFFKARFLTAPYVDIKQRCPYSSKYTSERVSERAIKQASEQAGKQASKQASKRREERGRGGRDGEGPHQETAPQKTSAVPIKMSGLLLDPVWRDVGRNVSTLRLSTEWHRRNCVL